MPSARDLIADGSARLVRSDLPAPDRAELAVTIAESWLALGDAGQAGQALALAARDADVSEARTLVRVALGLARIASQRGDFAAARTHYTHARMLADAAGDEGMLEATTADLGLGNLALYTGEYTEALERVASAHGRRVAARGIDDPATLDAGVALAVTLIANDRLDDAVDTFEATMAGADHRLGVPNAVSCRAGTSLSEALERRGDYQLAADAGMAAAANCRAVFGERHALYGQAELNAGLALGRLGRLDEALEHYRAARTAYAASGHFDEGSALRYAAGALMTLERWT